ncbi:MAG: thioredoxin [Peptococcaceae bacterium]|jgi:thioredoxin 1|nr:thioredoxin [Peptococcaceae bacterium]
MALTHVSDQQFDGEVLSERQLAVVDFWAPWCGPCKMQGPIVEELAGQYDGRAKICKMDTDQNQDTAVKYDIMSIPTLIFFKDGKEVARKVGLTPKAELSRMIDSYL